MPLPTPTTPYLPKPLKIIKSVRGESTYRIAWLQVLLDLEGCSSPTLRSPNEPIGSLSQA